MVISRTPYRISFFGGGTDYPSWYRQYGGAVLSTSIDKYCYISCRVLPPFFNIKHRIVWSHIEMVSSAVEILHPAVRAGLKYMGFEDNVGLEIHHQGDLPARSGMGSSSAFAVGLIKALVAMRGGEIDASMLAHKAIELEQVVIKDTVGSQDQVAAAYGGFNHIQFLTNEQIEVRPVEIDAKRLSALEDQLMLFYLGTSRLASEIAARVIASFELKKRSLERMHAMVDEALHLVQGTEALEAFGHLLHEAWLLKRGLTAEISNSTVDQIYETARQSGALGGKLLGAGGTGFMVFFVPSHKQAAVKLALPHLVHVPFRFEHEGSRLIYAAEEFQSPETASLALQ